MNAAQPLVSVIVPIYNVAAYLEQCLDSIAAQTLGELEVLCVNDGSTDESPKIIQKYVENDARFVFVDKPNGGYGSAVNRGLDEARGAWIGIVEPDDFIEPTMYADLLANAQLEDGGQADIVKSSFWMYYDGSDGQEERVEEPFFARVMPGFRMEADARTAPDLVRHHPAIWSAIYRKDFLEEHGIRMMEVKGAGWTDNPWLLETMLQAERIVWIPSAYYYYRQTNPGSSSNLKDCHLVFDRLRDMRGIYERLGVTDPNLLSALYSRTLGYITKQVLDEGAFPEADPEVSELIREALEPIDAGILLARESLVSAASKDYYRDFMGFKVRALKPRGRRPEPAFSLVLPLYDDRAGLWKTITSICKQSFTNFEVLIADCGSPDRGPQIAADVAVVDGRFEVVTGNCVDIASGFNVGIAHARSGRIVPLRAGAVLPAKFLASLDALLHEEADVDIAILESSLAELSRSRFSKAPRKILLEGSEAPFEVASTMPAAVGKCFSAAFLERNGIAFEGEADCFGHAFLIRACLARPKIAIAKGGAPDVSLCDGLQNMRARKGIGFADQLTQRWSALEEIGESEQQRDFSRSCICGDVRIAMEACLAQEKPKPVFEVCCEWLENDRAAREGLPITWSNYADYRKLVQASSLGYERWSTLAARKALEESRKLANAKSRAEASFGARAEKSAKAFAKSVLPTEVAKRIVKRKR